MAEETAKTPAGGTGSEAPVFKFEGGFDRAKYTSQEKAMITPDGQVTGSTIDDDLKAKKVTVEGIEKKAISFYNEKYDAAIKELDPSVDRASIFYREAETNAYRDQKEIKNSIEQGKSVDGKEIIDMASNSAANKMANVDKLKNGTVTQIAESLGWKRIEESDNYQEILEDFNKRMNNEKFSFEKIIDNLWAKFDDINDPENETGIKYSPEDNALISALAKILEGEGFKNESVTAMSSKYEENLNNFSEKSKGTKEGNLESSKTEEKKETGELKTTEEKLSEPKEKQKDNKEESKPIESAKSESTTELKNTDTGSEKKNEATASTLIENKISVDVNKSSAPANTDTQAKTETSQAKTETTQTKTETTQTKTEDKKIEGIEKESTENKKEGTPENKSIEKTEASNLSETKKEKTEEKTSEVSSDISKRQDDLMKSIFGIDAKGGKGSGEASSKQENLIESLFGSKSSGNKSASEEKGLKENPIESKSLNLDTKKDTPPKNTPKSVESLSTVKSTNTEQKTPKVEDKVSDLSKKNETSPVSAPIKETTKQNLSSAIPEIPKEKNEELKSDNSPQVKDENKNEQQEEKNSEQAKTNEQLNAANTEKEKNQEVEEQRQAKEKEMQDNIKMMVTLLTQLNNTLQNPLMVIQNEKKFA